MKMLLTMPRACELKSMCQNAPHDACTCLRSFDSCSAGSNFTSNGGQKALGGGLYVVNSEELQLGSCRWVGGWVLG